MTNLDENKKDQKELLQLVSFKIGDEEFGVDILSVQEINKMSQITKVPNTPVFIEGVINLRGRIIPVIDLRVKLGMIRKDHSKNTRIVVVELKDQTIGFIVDEVCEVLRIPKEITEAPPEMVGGVNSEYITSIGKLEDRLLILLDLNKILSTEEFKQIETAA
ncbi:MAG: chemotaxis protein CheW [Ignavibacterium sp.]|jgi:purine-binding chemotaxis protein CheW|nr:MAG: purine-binding chemotaxis protein CheW [Ignavibacterium sp.]MDX9711477.1 chemotaxis protein CheW [Ignavibacteriaceae bacterium]GIK22568.1 MAG: chemotaxis protein CheW [Ignavibacteriota bacterium]MCZ7610054.1 chemotaxis protein CheW [Ignavibacterium sp.]MDD5607598.1 chemotaxis protein CheW [Ignavibacterium sp.]